MNVTRYFTGSIFILLLLTSCTSLISQAALKAPQLNLDLLTPEREATLGYTRDRYCVQDQAEPCLAYLKAPAHDATSIQAWQAYLEARGEVEPLQTRSLEVALRYWPVWGDQLDLGYRLQLDTVGQQDDLQLILSEPTLSTHAAAYVLIHGFRTNKESLLFIAEALRYAGHDVFMFDLLGHGESDGRFTFSGQPDAQLISAFMDTQDYTSWHLLGMSMGGTTATHLARQRSDVRSLTLLGPMLEFVDAFVDAGRAYTRSAHLIPQSYLAQGASAALAKAGTARDDTKVVQEVESLEIPVLVFGSRLDQISLWPELEQLAGDNVKVHQVSDRSHHGMILWDTEDFRTWQQWFQVHHP